MIKNPYEDYEKTIGWKAVDKAINDLVKNNDLEEYTAREYVVGYIVKSLIEAKVLNTEGETN
jgi:hypothetical protein